MGCRARGREKGPDEDERLEAVFVVMSVEREWGMDRVEGVVKGWGGEERQRDQSPARERSAMGNFSARGRGKGPGRGRVEASLKGWWRPVIVPSEPAAI